MYTLAITETEVQPIADCLDCPFDIGCRESTHALDHPRQFVGIDGLDIDSSGM